MTDNLKKERRKKHKIDRNLKRTRDRFKLNSTQVAITEAFDAAPDLMVFDRDRVLAQLHKHRADFKHATDARVFRAQITAWITRQARYIVLFREILPTLQVDDWTATLLLLRLPEFNGIDEEFIEWIAMVASQEADGLNALATWITQHRRAVYRGAWKVLRGCRDLDNNLADIADCIASETWEYVANNVNEFLNSSKPITKQLSKKAENLARSWKTDRLGHDEGRPAIGYFIGENGLETTVKSGDGEDDVVDVSEDDVRNPNSYLNPIIIERGSWTEAAFSYDVRRVLRENRCGLFHADDDYGDTMTVPILAAA